MEKDTSAPEYVLPDVVRVVGNILREPRSASYSTRFADAISPDRDTQYSYSYGIILIMGLFLLFFSLWALVLVVLKLKGREVGCASGRAFHRPSEENALEFVESTDSSDIYSSDQSMHHEDISCGSYEGDQDCQAIEVSQKYPSDEHSDAYSSSPRSSRYSNDSQRDSFIESFSVEDTNEVRRVTKRERRTRIAFIAFGLVWLICVPLLLVYCFGSLKSATESADGAAVMARDAYNNIVVAVDSIDEAVVNSEKIMENTPKDAKTICPDVAQDSMTQTVGFDLSGLLDVVSSDYNSLIKDVNSNITTVRKALSRIDSGLDVYEEKIQSTEESLWMLPALVLIVMCLVVIAILGVIFAWKDSTGSRMQCLLSYALLPMLIFSGVTCFIVVMCFAFGSATTSDFCSSSVVGGSPDATIQKILSDHKVDPDSMTFRFVHAYTNRCKGSDPTETIHDLENEVQALIDDIWLQISMADSIGNAKIVSVCGSSEIEVLLSGARSLAKQLTVVRRALDSSEDQLDCGRINPIYVKAVHSSLCTDGASGMAFGFVFFLLLVISMMVLISLRASWLRNIEEEKVYHDEDEVAENMFLDEHEEYLEYISKYKHEWQEYPAIGNDLSSGDGERSYQDDESYYEYGQQQELEGYDTPHDVSYARDDDIKLLTMGNQNEDIETCIRRSESDDLDDISFPSLASEDDDIAETPAQRVEALLISSGENHLSTEVPIEIIASSVGTPVSSLNVDSESGKRDGDVQATQRAAPSARDAENDDRQRARSEKSLAAYLEQNRLQPDSRTETRVRSLPVEVQEKHTITAPNGEARMPDPPPESQNHYTSSFGAQIEIGLSGSGSKYDL